METAARQEFECVRAKIEKKIQIKLTTVFKEDRNGWRLESGEQGGRRRAQPMPQHSSSVCEGGWEIVGQRCPSRSRVSVMITIVGGDKSEAASGGQTTAEDGR